MASLFCTRSVERDVFDAVLKRLEDQQVRQSCNAIAAQVFLIAQRQHGPRSSTSPKTTTGTESTNTNTTDAATLNSNEKLLTSSSNNDGRAEELRRRSEAVASDAITLYRLCHRQGGNGTAIVPASASGGGGGAAEEAAYCVCAALMSREAQLWASLVRRAQMLHPRKPTLCFVAPVVMLPVVVKDVVKFYGRSRHLFPTSGSNVTATLNNSAASHAVSNTVAAVSSIPGAAGKEGAAPAGALSAQQAEAVAAAFFYKTMSIAERQRRPDVYEVQTLSSSSSLTTARPSVRLSGDSGAKVSASAVPSLSSTWPTSRKHSHMPLGVLNGVLPAMSTHHPSHHSLPSSALFLMDDSAGWRGGNLEGFRPSNENVAIAGQSAWGDAVGGVSGAWLHHGDSSSSTSDSDSDDHVSTSEFSSRDANRSLHATEQEDGGKLRNEHASTGAGNRRHTRVKAAVTDAAVLEKLYRLATTADAAMADDEQQEEEEAKRRKEGDDGADALRHHSGGGLASAYAATTTSVMSSSLFSSGKGMGLLSLAAMTTQMQDELHWGRLTALVRFPILFRGLSVPSSLFCASTSSVATSKALTASSMARFLNVLGSVYTSSLVSSPPSSASTIPAATSAFFSELHAAVHNFISAVGSPGSFMHPARLRSSSLLPRPPSSVTDTFLWTRLLICSAWLLVYADGLVEDNCGAKDSSVNDGDIFAVATLPRVRSSPLVQDMVAYCVAVVKEARAISTSLTGEEDEDASAYSTTSSMFHPFPGVSGTAAAASSKHMNTVCCPVCDGLIKEQKPVLWWSTLREDRIQLREQVRTLLENGSADLSEARVAAAVAADSMPEGRGGRPSPAPQLSGSGAARERIAALQERWGMYIMGKEKLADAVSVVHQGGGVEADESWKAAEEKTTNRGDTSNHRAGGEPSKEAENDNSGKDEATRTLWAALTQRVAAATDLCTFVSMHPIAEGHSANTSSGIASSRRMTARPQHSSSLRVKHARTRHGAAATGAKAKKRRRRSSTSSDNSEEETASSGSGDEAEDRKAAHHLRRSMSNTTDSDAELDHHHCLHPHHLTWKDESQDGGAIKPAYLDKEEFTTETTTRASNNIAAAAAFQGSRRAYEVTEEWARLLQRCGWVNVAPPRHPQKTSSTSYSFSPPPLPLSETQAASTRAASSSAAVNLYEEWAASLVKPSAVPTPSQAALLRRRLSRYSLEDVVRFLVLGRGGTWLQYATLMFGADLVQSKPASVNTQRRTPTGASEQQQQQQTGCKEASAEQSSENVLYDSGTLPPTPRRRAASMSLLEAEEDADISGGIGTAQSTGERERSSILPVVAGHEEAERGGAKVEPRPTHHSPSPPALTSPALLHQLSPPPPIRPFAKSSLLSSSASMGVVPSTPTRKIALPSIPLCVSPLRRKANARGGIGDDEVRDNARQQHESESFRRNNLEERRSTLLGSPGSAPLPSSSTFPASVAATQNGSSSKPDRAWKGATALSPASKESTRIETVDPVPDANHDEHATESCDDGAASHSQLRAQQAAIRALMRFRPRFPPLREEDAVLECASCFSLFHQDCIVPAQRDLMGQVFLCHTCRLKWARLNVEKDGEGGLISQVQEFSF